MKRLMLMLGLALLLRCSLLLQWDITGQPCTDNQECLTDAGPYICFQKKCRLLADGGVPRQPPDASQPSPDAGQPDAGP